MSEYLGGGRRRAAHWSEREGTHSPDLMRVTHAHPLNPAALAFVPFGIVLVRVRVPFLNAPPVPFTLVSSYSR